MNIVTVIWEIENEISKRNMEKENVRNILEEKNIERKKEEERGKR